MSDDSPFRSIISQVGYEPIRGRYKERTSWKHAKRLPDIPNPGQVLTEEEGDMYHAFAQTIHYLQKRQRINEAQFLTAHELAQGTGRPVYAIELLFLEDEDAPSSDAKLISTSYLFSLPDWLDKKISWWNPFSRLRVRVSFVAPETFTQEFAAAIQDELDRIFGHE